MVVLNNIEGKGYADVAIMMMGWLKIAMTYNGPMRVAYLNGIKHKLKEVDSKIDLFIRAECKKSN